MISSSTSGFRNHPVDTSTDPVMNSSPRISVIIPNYNQTQFVSGAINSVLKQGYRDFEIILVDDGSTDDSREVVSQFGDQVCYLWQDNQGLAGARNTGIKAARGELIGLLDADDEWLPDYLEKMVSLADRYPEAAVYYCCAQSMDVNAKDLPQRFGGPVVSPGEIYHQLLRANFIIPSTVMLRRSIIAEAGYFDQALRSCEDWDLWLRLLPDNKFAGTSDCLVRYRIHGSSLSKNLQGMHRAARATIEKNFGLPNGPVENWSADKRRAYGGLYRYLTLTSFQDRNDLTVCSEYLTQALIYDPTLADEVGMYYDLALGSQPPGYRGTSHELLLQENYIALIKILDSVFENPVSGKLIPKRNHVFSKSNYAFGLVAYNNEVFSLARIYLMRSFFYQPGTVFKTDIGILFLKSLMGHSLLGLLKGLIKRQ